MAVSLCTLAGRRGRYCGVLSGKNVDLFRDAIRAVNASQPLSALPSRPKSDHFVLGKEKSNVKRTSSGPTSGSRQRSAGWKGTASGSRPPSAPASVVSRSSATEYERHFGELIAAYPRSRLLIQADGIWLLVRSKLVQGLDREAIFVVAIPFSLEKPTQAWGFWSRGNEAFAQWIGPRHTNFPHGSICAFDVADDVWRTGASTVTLLDLYSVWAVRHLYLEHFGRWPGPQRARWPHERRLECRPDELCGCGSLEKTYAECCHSHDVQRDALRDAVSFLLATNGGHRSPPIEIVGFLRRQSAPPPMAKFF